MDTLEHAFTSASSALHAEHRRFQQADEIAAEQLLTGLQLQADLERERRLSDALQHSLLLPRVDPRAFPGMWIATHYEAALQEAQVGGDFYDAFSLPDGRIALVVGDASGKGLAAAGRAAETRLALRSYLRNPWALNECGGVVPEVAMARLNDLLCTCQFLDDSNGGAFISLTLAVVDTYSGEATFVRAGGEQPLILRGTNDKVDVIEGGGMVLGIRRGERFPVARCCLSPGDTLLLFTDGLTEARVPRKKSPLFGADGVTRSLCSAHRMLSPAHRTPQYLIRNLVRDIQCFCEGNITDDRCIVASHIGTIF